MRLTEITRASSAPLFSLEEVGRRFDEDSMLAIFIKQRGMATFLLARRDGGGSILQGTKPGRAK